MLRNLTLSLILVVSIFVWLGDSAALSLYEQKKYQHLINGQGLYSDDDDVEILTKNTFNARVYNQPNAWIVEFYNSWCGFCQRFAPSWKALASDIRNWKSRINVGAIDCSDDDNNVICREFEIMAYPTLRYFHEFYAAGPKKFGDTVEKGEDVAGHKAYLLEKLVQEQADGRGKQYPNLQVYNHTNLNHMFVGIPVNTKYVFLVIEDETKYGLEVALDLADVPQIAVKYAQAQNKDLLKFLSVTKTPHMIVLSDTNESQQFAEGLNSRESFKMAIQKFLVPKEITVPVKSNENIFTGKWIEAEVPDISSLLEAREKKALRDKIKKMGDVVFQGDLESTLRYLLKHEISFTASIEGEKRDALIAFLDLIVRYFPLTNNGRAFIFELSERVKSFDPLYGKDLGKIIKKMEDDTQKIFSSKQQWLACDGSAFRYRGFPCGLWKLFHYLTVNAALANNNNPNEVLRTMHGYIKHFFGCADCSQHFQEMAKERRLEAVSSLDESVLWLWSAHNVVNKRLAGDTTEDPEFPKIQFPDPGHCPSCRHSDGTFNESEVLKYLKNMYNNVNVRYIGSDTTLLVAGLGQQKVTNSASSASLSLSSPSAFVKSIDSSMCFILYVASLILIIILIRMFLKRGYRKKMYVHDLLGKV